MTTALVTGGAGFIGSHVVDELLRTGRKVVVLDDFSGGFARNVDARATIVQGTIVDHQFVERTFQAHPIRHVYHLAAYAAEGLSHFIRRFNYETNVIGSMNLINAAVRHEAECFVFASSAAVYGERDGLCRESDAPSPVDPYGIAKSAVEQDLRTATRIFGMKHIIFRPHNVYGERQNLADPYRNVIGIFMRQVLSGSPCTLFGDGAQTREFSHVADVAPVIARSVECAAASNQTFNIGASQSCSVRELADRIQRAFGRQVGVEHLPPRVEAVHVRCDHARTREVFGADAAVGLDQGIERMAHWARSITLALPRRCAEIEIERNLPPSWRE